MGFCVETDEVAPNEEALRFLNDITANDIQPLLFPDILLCYSANSIPVGNYKCDVTFDTYDGRRSLYIKCACTNRLGEIQCDTSVETHLTFALETIVHSKTERIIIKVLKKIHLLKQFHLVMKYLLLIYPMERCVTSCRVPLELQRFVVLSLKVRI